MRAGGHDLGVAFDGDGDRMLAVDGDGNAVDGDQILAILALHLGVDVVAVTVMTNLGFHRLMEERGIRVVTTAGRRPLRARGAPARGRDPRRRAVRPRRSASATTSPATGSPPRCSSAGRSPGATLAEAAAVMPRYAQAKENVRVVAPRGAGSRARGGRAPQRGAGRQRPRARPRLRHGAADPGARGGRDGGGGRKTSVVGSRPSSRGSSASPRRCGRLCRALALLGRLSPALESGKGA